MKNIEKLLMGYSDQFSDLRSMLEEPNRLVNGEPAFDVEKVFKAYNLLKESERTNCESWFQYKIREAIEKCIDGFSYDEKRVYEPNIYIAPGKLSENVRVDKGRIDTGIDLRGSNLHEFVESGYLGCINPIAISGTGDFVIKPGYGEQVQNLIAIDFFISSYPFAHNALRQISNSYFVDTDTKYIRISGAKNSDEYEVLSDLISELIQRAKSLESLHLPRSFGQKIADCIADCGCELRSLSVDIDSDLDPFLDLINNELLVSVENLKIQFTHNSKHILYALAEAKLPNLKHLSLTGKYGVNQKAYDLIVNSDWSENLLTFQEEIGFKAQYKSKKL